MQRSTLIRVLALATCAALLSLPAVAQEADSEDAPAGSTGRVDDKKFPLFLEVLYGNGSSDGTTTPIVTSQNVSRNTFTLADMDNVRASIGWALDGGMDESVGKGRFRLVFNGYKETDYEFVARGQTFDVADLSAPPDLDSSDDLQTWWNIMIAGGELTAIVTQPSWDSTTDDTDGDGIPDPDEITSVATAIGGSKSVTDSLQNQIQSVDFLYERSWGKRVINASWGAGLRYFVYEGNYPMAVWLRSSASTVGGQVWAGYTNGLSTPILTVSQETTGIGPTGYGELHFNFLRDRVQLYTLLRASFVLMDYETDTGEFTTFVFDGTGGGQFLTAPARLENEFEKDSWQTGLEVGSRFRLAEGLHLSLAYHLSSYQDAVLLPNELSIPDAPAQIGFGTTATYNTRDFKLDGWRAGFAFQF